MPRVLTMRARLSDETGIALVMALGIMLVLVITLTAVITFTAAGARDSHRVNAGQKATALAEAGLNNAFAVLNTVLPRATLLPRVTRRSCPRARRPTRRARSRGRERCRLHLSARAGATSGASRRPGRCRTRPARAQRPSRARSRPIVPVTPPTVSEIGDDNPLNYIYAEDTLSSCSRVTVASPVYATDDLHLENSSTISEFIGNVPGKKNRVAVGGVFYAAQNANRIGHVTGTTSPANNLEEVYIVGGCNTKNFDNNVHAHSCAVRRRRRAGRSDLGRRRCTGSAIPPDFLDYIPTLTCCAPYPTIPSARTDRHAAGRQQHGPRLQDRRPRAARAVHDGLRSVHVRRAPAGPTT